MFRFRFVLLAALPAAALVLASACSGQDQNAGQASQQAITLHYTLVPSDSDQAKVGPDGQKHDTFATTDNTVIPLGARVTIEIKNYDNMPHGMAFPGLGMSQVVKAGTDDSPAVTTFTFNASKAGDFRWYCPVPCDTDAGQWAMGASSSGLGQDGFMAGLISVK